MPRGGARVGAGRKPKPRALHVVHGTYRPARHGALPSAVPSPASPDWAPTEDDLSSLGAAGRAVVDRVLALYAPSVTDGLQLLEAAHAADVLAQLRAAPEPDLREERQWAAFYTSTVRMLGLTK